MAMDLYVGTWSIDFTSNLNDFPAGKTQKIVLSRDGSHYILKWQVKGGQEATFSPLYPQPNGTVLSNLTAEGHIEGTHLGQFRVEVLLQHALRRIAGSAEQPAGTFAVPGQLVGQWGAESTGGMEEGKKPKKDKNAKPGKSPAKKAAKKA